MSELTADPDRYASGKDLLRSRYQEPPRPRPDLQDPLSRPQPQPVQDDPSAVEALKDRVLQGPCQKRRTRDRPSSTGPAPGQAEHQEEGGQGQEHPDDRQHHLSVPGE